MKKIYSLILLLLFSHSSYPATLPKDAIYKNIQRFTDFNNYKPDSALVWIEKGLLYAQKENDYGLLAFCYLNKGNLFGEVDPDRATKYLFQALKIFQGLKDVQGEASVYNNFGIYSNLPGEEKLMYLQKALKINKHRKDTLYQLYNYINIGKVYFNTISNMDSALIYFNKGYELSRLSQSPSILAVILTNKACISAEHYHDTAEGIRLLKEAIKIAPEEWIYNVSLKHNLLTLYFKSNLIDSAMYYYNKIKDQYHLQPQNEFEVYRLLAEYHFTSGNTAKGFAYINKSDSVKDHLRSRNTENLLSFLQIEHEAKIQDEKVNTLNAEIHRGNIIRILMASLLILTTAFFFILMHLQKQKNKKKRELIIQKKQNTEAELRNSELQRQFLNDELKFTNKELSSFAASIVKNSDHLNDFKVRIDELLKEKDLRKMKRSLSDLKMQLIQLFNNDEQRKEFIERSRKINHSLIFYLKSTFPQLSDKDINLMILLLLKFNSKEIATLYNIETSSIGKKRYRLRQKIGLTDRESFEEFFDKLLENYKISYS